MVKNPPANAGASGDMNLILGSGISPGEGNGNPLQYSCQRNPMDRGAWWATVHGVAKESDRTEHAHCNSLYLICDPDFFGSHVLVGSIPVWD